MMNEHRENYSGVKLVPKQNPSSFVIALWAQ